jgi:hypothetical protein
MLRNHTTMLRHDLNGPQSKRVTVVPATGTVATASFSTDGIPARLGVDNFNYVQFLRIKVVMTFDQAAAAGVKLNADDLYRQISAVYLTSPDLGTVYPRKHMKGPLLGLVAQPIGNGYRFPFAMRPQIATADGDTTVTLVCYLPLGMFCFTKGHHLGVWAGHLAEGTLEVDIAASDALAAVAVGAVIKAPTYVEATAIYMPESEARIPLLALFRQYETPGNLTNHTIRNIGVGDGLNGVDRGCGLALLAYLSNKKGLGGADTIDKITAVEIPSRAQQRTLQPESYMEDFWQQMGGNATSGGSIASDVQNEGGRWPYEMGAAVDKPNHSSGLFMPFIAPGAEQELTKIQKWQGDYLINLEYSATPAAAGQWATLEVFRFLEDAKDRLQERMGLSTALYRRVKKFKNKQSEATFPDEKKMELLPDKIIAR